MSQPVFQGERTPGKSAIDVAVTDVLEELFNSSYVAEFKGFVIWVTNTGANPITTADIEVSPDGVQWFLLDDATFKLAPLAGQFLKVEGFPHFRFRGSCDIGLSTTIDIGITMTGSKGL